MGADADAVFAAFRSEIKPKVQSNSIQTLKLAIILNIGVSLFTRLGFLHEQYAVSIERLDSRLVSIYESETPGTLDIVLSSHSFTEMLDRSRMRSTTLSP